MSRKSLNKRSSTSATPSWYHCEKCDVHITAKEREKHEQKCPIMDNDEHLEYIRKGTLYTESFEKLKFDIEELKEMPPKYINNLIFLSEGAIRLAGWHIGQEVVIKSNNSKRLVRSIWPIPEKFLTTICVSEQDFLTHWSPLTGQYLRVEAVPAGQPKVAKTLLLQIQASNEEDEPLNSQQLKDVDRLLKLELRNLSFTLDSMVYFDFFNKSLVLKIIYWSAVDNSSEVTCDLEQSVRNLNINKHSGDNIFKVTNSTTIEVSSESIPDSDEESEDESKYLITRNDIGGLNKQLTIIEEAIDFALGLRIIPNGVKISRGLLIHGSSGCGKTMICEAMCSRLLQKNRLLPPSSYKPLILKLNTSELFSKFLGETEKNLTAYFNKAYQHYPHPSLLVIEDIQNLCPKHETNEVVKRVSAAFLNMMDTLANKREAQKCFLLATTSQIELLNPSIRRCGRIDCEVEVAPPTPDGRRDIIKCLLRKVDNHILSPKDVQQIAQVTHGFVGADLANLIYNATLKSMTENKTQVSVQLRVENLISALAYVKPSAMREVLIECPNIKWTDIGGQDELKLKLKQAIEWPLKHAEQFRRLGIKPPKGLLMYGPPGCSKTMIAKALATESQLNFLSIKGPELFSMWVGESERAVREVFRKARQVAPAIIFFDEIDAIGGERSDGSSGSGSSVKERVLTQLLTELDGVESLDNVTIVAATNRPDMIDKALLRPGRIDRIVYVGLPDAEARQEIFRIKLQKMPLSDDVNLAELVNRTNGYSGAEIQAICHEAALKTLEESFEATCVTWSQFEYALKAVKPRTSSDLLRLYEEYMNKS